MLNLRTSPALPRQDVRARTRAGVYLYSVRRSQEVEKEASRVILARLHALATEHNGKTLVGMNAKALPSPFLA